MEVWFKTGVWMNQGINIYVPKGHIGYPPLWALWCSLAYSFYSFLVSSIEIWRLIIKLPLIISQFALAYALGKFAENRFDQKTAQRIFFFALTWSFFIYTGALWGQINLLSALLTFLAFYAVINQRTTESALLLGTAVALKIYPIVALPAFFAYVLKKRNRKEAGMFLLCACAVPVLFTLAIFTVFQWDILSFLRTIFYTTPIFESSPILTEYGSMNAWSFLSTQSISFVPFWPLRLLWIPILAVGAFYWLRKPRFDEADLNLSIISFYVLFMISYGWVTEQAFIDPLPFVFLLILGYRPKRAYLYLLAAIQILIYAFTITNQSLFIFAPLLERFSPPLLAALQNFHLSNGHLLWMIRGTLGLIVSLSLAVFLALLMKPEVVEQARDRLHRVSRRVRRRSTQ